MHYIQKKAAFYAGLIYFCAAVSGCLSTAENTPVSNSPAPFLPDKTASVQKDILLIFTGSDWSSDSPLFMQHVLTAEVRAAIEKDFTVQYIDLPRNTEHSDAQDLQRNYLLFSRYHVTDVPFIVMQTPEQDSYAAQPLAGGLTSGTEFIAVLDSLRKNREAVTAARNQVTRVSGFEKALAIDKLLNTVLYSDSHQYDSLRMQVPDLDPDNRSGLKGKYLLITADMHAKQFAQKENFTAAGDAYKAAAESGILNPEELQLAWYFAAYSYSMSKNSANEQIVACLHNAIQANPNSTAVEQLKEILKKLERR
ncbi:MAG: tetratricopeptide repeat protein [Treponema sp.]